MVQLLPRSAGGWARILLWRWLRAGEGSLHQIPRDGMDACEKRVVATFASLIKSGGKYFCFHDVDVAPSGNSWEEFQKNVDYCSVLLSARQKRTVVKCLGSTQNLFSRAKLEVLKGYAKLTFDCKRMPAKRWLPRGFSVLSSDQQFHTFVRSIPKDKPGFRPAGLEGCSQEALAPWRKHGFRFPPYQYEGRNLIYSAREKAEVPLPSQARELLLHFRKDHTFPCLRTADRKANPMLHEDTRLSLLGNSFQCAVVAFLSSHLLAARGYLARPASAAELADPAIPPQGLAKAGPRTEAAGSAQAWGERELDGELLLARMYFGLQSHRGNEVRQETSGNFEKRGLLQSIDGRMWRWRTIISSRWRKKGEHINTLEARAVLLLLKWRCRSVKYMQSKFLHLIDNTSVHGALVKGRTSSRRLKYVIKKSQSYVLAGNLHPLFGYTRSHTNPADHPSRRFPLRSTGARGN